MVKCNKRSKYTYADLIEIMDVLRSENGCPWDKEQDHRSIRKNLIEEAYEVCDGIDRNDRDAMCEELGDLLLQVVFHAKIASDEGQFDHLDVTDGICRKLIFRHPHIFGDVKAGTSAEVLDNWEKLKVQEKQQKTYTETIEQVPACLPGLMRAQKVQHRAAKAKFDFASPEEAMAKVREETGELAECMGSDPSRAAEEFGDLLFACVNVGRLLGLDCEEALTAATDKFARRFAGMESAATQMGKHLADMQMPEMDKLWEFIKKKEK